MVDHINNIIASGLLERYVIGDVSRDEQRMVELLRVDHISVRERLAELEHTKEKMAACNTIDDADERHACIMKNISGGSVYTPPVEKVQSRPAHHWWKIAAASVACILGTWIVMTMKMNDLQSVQNAHEAELSQLNQNFDKLNDIYAFYNHGGTMPYLLDGASLDKKSQVIIYWNRELGKSMLKVVELPSIRANETYQLWADISGEMHSLGTFDAGLAVIDAIPMQYEESASSLNITIEPSGGSDHPSLSTLTANVVF